VTEGDIREQKSEVFRAGEVSSEAPMERFIDQYGDRMSSEFEQDLRESAQGGYNTGNLREDQQGQDPETD
jgi:hypothetical protein